jgi:hypothetical protein
MGRAMLHGTPQRMERERPQTMGQAMAYSMQHGSVTGMPQWSVQCTRHEMSRTKLCASRHRSQDPMPHTMPQPSEQGIRYRELWRGYTGNKAEVILQKAE